LRSNTLSGSTSANSEKPPGIARNPHGDALDSRATTFPSSRVPLYNAVPGCRCGCFACAAHPQPSAAAGPVHRNRDERGAQPRASKRPAAHRVPPASRAWLLLAAFLSGPAFEASAATGGSPDAATGRWVHAYAAYGEPKYPPGFAHFGYANPDAPKGGTMYLSNPDRRTSFDKFNPFTVKGNSPAGVMILMFETLAVMSGDELATMYGLLAEFMLVAPDKSSITVRLNPMGRFANGDPVTAADVKHSFDMLTSKRADPTTQTRLGGVQGAVVLDAGTIRFDLKDRSNDTIFNVGTRLPVFSRKWGIGPDGKPKDFDQIVSEYPIASGPYTIAVADSGRRLEFVRNKDYWARDLGIRRGQFNFDRVVYRYYQDSAVAMEAFKAGEFDLLQEYSARRWSRQHAGPKWRDGRIVKEKFINGFGAGLQSYILNLRRPLFQDPRVREALEYTYDFDSVNVYRQYQRTYSMFSNSEFAATGVPGPGELALLEPFRPQLPPAVFSPAWQPPSTDEGPNTMRRNLLKARSLLEDAGWKVAPDGVLRDAKGQPFEFEYLEDIGGGGRTAAVWQRNLAKLGIRMNLREVDFALMTKRQEAFDFDMIQIRTTDFTLPNVAELRDEYSSKSADTPGSNNFRGVKSPAVDFLLEKMQNAQTLDELRDASRALDRVVMHGDYQVPDLYSGSYRVSHWDKFGIPATRPKFYTIDSGLDVWPAWAVIAWWSKDAEKR
jgi:peptide/nickel transport system substrate-binding protein/microcin C transport system substrate-binding protein